MSFTSWLRNLCSSSAPDQMERKHRRRRSPRAATHRPHLEALEDRCQPSFLAPVNYAAGPGPDNRSYAVVTADFNGDSRLDLAVTNYDSSTVSVLLGNADGTFQPARTSDTGYLPFSLAVGDFNADGKVDLATVNGYDVSVLLGNADGTFQPPSSILIDSGAASVAVGDFNADGKLDLGVSSNGSQGYASVLLGNGDGSFSVPSTTAFGYGNLVSAVVADFNRDGKLDFATGEKSYRTVSVLLGDGLGNLQPPTDFPTGSLDPQSVAAGDVNGDGNIDLLTANWGSNTVSVLLGNGLGSFGSAQIYATGSGPTAVVLGDFNRDGQVDLMTNALNSNVSMLFGIGGGAFSPPRNFAAGSFPYAVVAGDFNGDGWLDAATADYNNVRVLINDTHWPPADAPSITINDVSVTEGNTGTVSATFTVSLSAAYGQPVTVGFTTADGSAAGGSDYTAGSGTLTFVAGQTTQTFTVSVIGDRLAEPTENFVVNLSAPTNATIADGQGIGTILDDEPRISINDVMVTEGNTGAVNATFTVSLPVACDVAVTVHYQTANGSATAGSDYAAASGDVIIAAGQTTKTFTVAVIGDRSAEPTETFVVNLSAASNGLIVDSQGVGTIVDDEPRISISDVTKAEGKKGQTTLFTFTVTLSAAYDQAVTMSFRTVNGTATTSDGDYVAKTGTLTFAPGETTKTITIEVKGDSKKEANETFYLDLFGNSSNALFTKNRGIGTILNDD